MLGRSVNISFSSALRLLVQCSHTLKNIPLQSYSSNHSNIQLAITITFSYHLCWIRIWTLQPHVFVPTPSPILPMSCCSSSSIDSSHKILDFFFFNFYNEIPWWLSSTESTQQCKRHGFNPWVGKTPSPGEGNGNPVQYSYLENSMDGGAWRATVHGVAKNRTRLSNFTFRLL